MSVFRYELGLWRNHLKNFVLFLDHLLEYLRRYLNGENSSLIISVPSYRKKYT